MPSDRPPPEPPSPGSDPAGKRRPTGAVRDGTLVFALVLSAFVAYALGAPATFRATAVVGIEPIPGSSPVVLPKADEATQRLRRAALDPALVARLASEERPAPPDTATQVATRITNTLSVESRDGRSFTFSATGSSPERSQRLVNELAQQAAKRAVQILDPEPPAAPDPGARAKAELLDFLAAHPGVASESSAAPVRSGPDPLILALRAERIRIEKKLAEPPSPPSGENPYDEPPLLEKPEYLKRRLKEIDTALEARGKPAPRTNPGSAGSSSSPEVRAEWQRLLKAASETRNPEPAPAPTLRLRVTLARASLPRFPIEPDRPRLVLLGVLFSAVAGVLAGLLRGSIEARAYRQYGMTTGKHPIAGLPQTTLRIPRSQLPKPLAPRSEPPPTPVPAAPAQPIKMTPIPPAPLVPTPITPIPPAPIAPSPVTSIQRAPLVPAPVTPIPPPPLVPAPATPIPPAGGVPTESAALGATPEEAPAPMVVQGPEPTPDIDGPPTTQGYEELERPARGRKSGRRITQIYGTPPPPDISQEQAKALRTTQAYGSPPVAVSRLKPEVVPYNPTPIPAEVLPPARTSSLKPSPMIPVARSSAPPAVAPSTRSAAPLAETGYSYVRTPVPEAHSIPQTPYPRRPSPPPQTQPYGSLPPVQPRRPPSDPPAPDPNRQKTPLPPAPELGKAPPSVIRTHPVLTSWRPDGKLAPGLRRDIAGEILTLAVSRCHIIGVTGIRGMGDQKSRAAVEIAFALSEAKHPRILLVEADFHFPQIQNWLKLEVPLAAGFSQQLRSRIQGSKDGRWHVVECLQSLHVLAEGVMRSPGLLLSNQFEQAMRELRSYYDIIVIDAPLAPGEADGQALADVVDGAVVVGPQDRATEIVEVSRIFTGKKLLRVLET